jgi:hypothetical protein
MPYSVRKAKCKQSDGDSGSYVLSYTDNKGKKHRNCHTSRKKAKAQIAAIEMPEGIEESWVPLAVRLTEMLEEELAQLAGDLKLESLEGDIRRDSRKFHYDPEGDDKVLEIVHGIMGGSIDLDEVPEDLVTRVARGLRDEGEIERGRELLSLHR